MKRPETRQYLRPVLLPGSSRAAQTLTAIQTLVTSAVAHGHMAATRTRRRVLLKVRHGVTQTLYLTPGRCRMAVAIAAFHFHYVVFLGNRQFRHRAVHLFF